MKKRMFLVITMFVMVLSLFGTLIPDDSFREKINEKLGQPTEYEPTEADLNGIADSLGITSCNPKITSIEGTQYLTGLTKLIISSQEISDISAITDLTNLIYVSFTSNLIVDITPVSNLTNLTHLYLFNNQISDINSIVNLTNLQELSLSYNQIINLPDISNLTNLEKINLCVNQISIWYPFRFPSSLTNLDLSANPITSVYGIWSLPNLTDLFLIRTEIVNFLWLETLENLTQLYLAENSLRFVPDFSNNTNLTHLYLYDNLINDISELSKLASLTTLVLANNQISDFSPLSNLMNLSSLSLNNNNISELIAFSEFTHFPAIYLFGNQISDLSPLIENENFDSGSLYLYSDYFDSSNPLSQEAINVQIPIFQSRGISVTYEETPNNNVACYPIPTRNTDEVGLYIPLQWQGNFGRNASYEVWLGESSKSLVNIGNGNHISGTDYFIISSLNPNTQYWWKVKATYGSEEVWSGLWSFTTVDGTSPATQEQTIPANDQTEQIFADVSTAIQFVENHTGTELEITETFAVPNVVGSLPAGVENVASRFWSVVSSAGNIGDYEITFDLSGVGGIQNFGTLRFLKRENNASAWQDVVADLGATLVYNEAEMKITIQGLNAFSEFAPAGGGDNTLPIELSSFSAVQTTSNFAQIKWQTQSETNLMGYNIYRNLNNLIGNSVIINNNLIAGSNTSSTQNYSFIDEEVENEAEYYYWLESIDLDGTSTLFGPTSVKIENSDQPEDAPDLNYFTEIQSIFPNPFNPSTTISFSLNFERNVKISVYNTKGQLIKKLVDGIREKGNHSVIWNGKDSNNKMASSGVYFFKMIADKKILTEKAILLK